MKRWLICIVLLLVAGGCASDEDPVASPRKQRELTSVAERQPTLPEKVIVENRAFGGGRRLIARAIRDLKALGYWDDLTDHLYVVHIQSRLGRAEVPDDGHLADAILNVRMDERGAGGVCDVMFFPTAIDDDLVRWTDYYESGLLDRVPPTLQDFWTSILAHELAHCETRPGIVKGVAHRVMRGEPYAERWERKVLEALQS